MFFHSFAAFSTGARLFQSKDISELQDGLTMDAIDPDTGNIECRHYPLDGARDAKPDRTAQQTQRFPSVYHASAF
ncbi:MAG: hypothetical protein AAGF79_15045 [Pseudomonadota bacterium]